MVDDMDMEVFRPRELTKPIVIVKQQGIRRFLEREEVNARLDAMPASKLKVLFKTLWMTGCRVSEVINIRQRDVDFQHKAVRIRWQKSRKFHERIIPLHPMLAGILQLYSMNHKADQLLFDYSRVYVYVVCKKHMGINPHGLRHSFAVNFIRQSKTPMAMVILQRYLGHAHITETMKYLRIVPEEIAHELEKIQF